jgi:hypothetical protein
MMRYGHLIPHLWPFGSTSAAIWFYTCGRLQPPRGSNTVLFFSFFVLHLLNIIYTPPGDDHDG